jgi:N-methylhydantoinase B/oxoprolinase/acetone carboxylase alpha subunit
MSEKHPRWTDAFSSHIDPITFQVVGKGFESIAREMGTTMMRTAYSSIFVEGLDFSCAILDRWAEMAAQANYNPVHLGAMAYAAEWSVMEIGYENLLPGDVLIHNDPYRGGTHITDVTVVKPVFYKDRLVAMAANRAHQLDMGGMTPGGFAGNATEITQEGLILPPVKWYDGGKEVRDIFDIILSNVRLPNIQIGDFEAQLASCITAERRILDFCEKYGADTVIEILEELKNYSERRMRSEIEAMPDGNFEYEDFIDNDGITDDPYRIKVSIKIRGRDVTFDYTGSSPQCRGPMNAVYGITASSTYNSLLSVSDPDIPVNHGCFRPVQIVAPRGTIVNAEKPAPTFGGNTDTSIRIMDACWGAFYKAIPERVTAATYGAINNFTGGGYDPERKRFFVWYFYLEGGYGARPDKDGINCAIGPCGNDKDQPVELLESIYPLTYQRRELLMDSPGPGKFRGGMGTVHEIEFHGERVVMNLIGERFKFQPYGLSGGKPAINNGFFMRREGNTKFVDFIREVGAVCPGKVTGVPLSKGDTIRQVVAGGGGYGDPFDRDPELVLRDVRDGFISKTSAKKDYGVILRSRSGKISVDWKETQAYRAAHHSTTPYSVDGVSVGKASYDFRRLGPHDQSSDQTSRGNLPREAKGHLDQEICRNECPKRAHPKKCPFHNEEALNFWSLDAFGRWVSRHCMQRASIPLSE